MFLFRIVSRVLLALAFLAVALVSSAAEARPNIIFLLGDDLRWDAMRHAGNPIIETPALDRLAADGVSFTNSYVTTSICMVSRATFFTGQYESAHKIHDFATPFAPEAFARTYPMLLRAAGYHTGFIGKWGIGGDLPEKDFDFFEGFPGQGHYYDPEDKDEKGPHLTARMGDHALAFLEGAPADKPFLLSVSFKAPHVQDQDPRQFISDHNLAHLYAADTIPAPRKGDPAYFEALPEFMHTTILRERWEKRFATEAMYQESVKNYYRLVTGIDRVVARIREALEARGAAGNTVIVFTGDNGMFLGEMGFAGKWFMHEESIRVPLLIHDPRQPDERRNQKLDAVALNIDIAPTLLSLAGLPAPEAMQGRDLAPWLRGEAPPWRSEWYYEHHYIRDRVPGIPATEGVHTGRWKYIRYPDSEPLFEELYDMHADPHELANLAKDPAHADTLEQLRARWAAWREAVQKTGPKWSEPR